MTRNAHTRKRDAGGGLLEDRRDAVDGRAARLRHQHVDGIRIEHVEIECDVHRVHPGEGSLERVVDPRLVQVAPLRRVEVACAHERDVLGGDDAVVEEHPQRHAPEIPGGRRRRRVQVTVRIEPDDGEAATTSGEAAHGSDVRATTAAEDEWPLREHRRQL
jgi:hypothetical protein